MELNTLISFFNDDPPSNSETYKKALELMNIVKDLHDLVDLSNKDLHRAIHQVGELLIDFDNMEWFTEIVEAANGLLSLINYHTFWRQVVNTVLIKFQDM